MEFVQNNQKIIVSALAFVLIMSFAVFAGPESCAETGNGGPVTEVTVTNVDELLNAVAPNTCITLKAGTYNLSTASTYGGLNGGACWRWQEAYDGYELTIESIDNLTIQGEGKDLVTILAEPRYATVLNFNRCTNVTLKGFTAGHTEAPAFCAGNVLGFNNCQETAIENCGMFGCGVIGIYAQNCTDMTVKNSDIYDCSYGAVYLYGSRNVMVDGCSIRDHGSEGTDTSVAYLFCLDSSDNISIRNSVIKDNYVQNLLAMGYSRNVVFAGNTVEKNNFFSSVFSSQRNSPVVEGCSFSSNSINSWYENNDVYAVDVDIELLRQDSRNLMEDAYAVEADDVQCGREGERAVCVPRGCQDLVAASCLESLCYVALALVDGDLTSFADVSEHIVAGNRVTLVAQSVSVDGLLAED